MNRPKRVTRRELVIVTLGVVLGVSLWLLVDTIIDHNVGSSPGASRDKFLSLEVMITSLIAASFALTEIMKLARVVSHGVKPETLRLRDAICLLVALAGSSTIFGAYAAWAKHFESTLSTK